MHTAEITLTLADEVRLWIATHELEIMAGSAVVLGIVGTVLLIRAYPRFFFRPPPPTRTRSH